MKQKLWIALITCLAYCVDKELYKAIAYRKTQVEVLLEQQEEDKRILLNNHQRRRLARKAKALTRKLLQETTVLFTPETVLGWYRKLIATKYDGSRNRTYPGRPKIHKEIISWTLRMREEDPRWGSQRICDVLNSLSFEVCRTRVHQGLGRTIDPKHGGNTGEICSIERLGGLLKSYHRKAASHQIRSSTHLNQIDNIGTQT